MARPRQHSVVCPNPLHEGGKVVSNGRVQRKEGPVLRFRCEPLLGGPHYFSIGTQGGRRVRGQRGAPSCPDHPGSTVRRNGRYGSGSRGRQRYRCDHRGACNASCATRRRHKHATCRGFHNFTPILPRSHVEPGDQCDECLELRGIHRGDRVAARRQRLTSRHVARLLSEIAAGLSYTQAGMMALDYAEVEVSLEKLRRKDTSSTKERKSSRSPSSRLASRVWHVGADLVEAFGPVVWDELDGRLRGRSAAIADAGHPRVWILDDLPFHTDVEGKKKLAGGYAVLVLAELDPLDPAVPWRAKLRLARAFPRVNRIAYRLLFDEMGYEPDLVIADASAAISIALHRHYDGRVRTVPSVWHIVRAMKDHALKSAIRKPDAVELREHLDALGRRSDHLRSVEGWTAWWDELIRLAVDTGVASRERLMIARADYESRMAESLPILLANERLPMSNAPVETIINEHIKPIFTRRRQFSFGNIERTNNLLDLVVARSHGSFRDLNEVARLIERDVEANDGRTVPLRSIADPQPRAGHYRSLRDETVMLDVAAERGLV